MNVAFNRFQRAAGAAPARARSKYAGLKAGGDRLPQPQVGSYIFEIVDSKEEQTPGKDPYFKVTLKVVESDNGTPAGALLTYLQCVSNKAMSAAGPRIKSFIMAAMGIDDEAEYDEADPDGALIDAAAGTPSAEFGENPLAGRVVGAIVTRGKDTADGTDFFRSYVWEPLPESEGASA